jgi:hypothetical protein
MGVRFENVSSQAPTARLENYFREASFEVGRTVPLAPGSRRAVTLRFPRLRSSAGKIVARGCGTGGSTFETSHAR